MWGWRCQRKPNRPPHLCTIRSTVKDAQRTALMTRGTAGSVPGVPGTSDGQLSNAPVGINRAELQYLAVYNSLVLKGDMKYVPGSYKFFCWLLYSFFFFSRCDDCGPIEMAVILTRPFIWLVAPLLLSFIPSICHTGMAQMWLTAKFCRPLMWSVSGGVHKMQQGLCRLHVIEGKWSVAPEHLRGVS